MINTCVVFFFLYFFYFVRYPTISFSVAWHVRQKGLRFLFQRHDIFSDAFPGQRVVLSSPTGRVSGHQALRNVTVRWADQPVNEYLSVTGRNRNRCVLLPWCSK